MSTISRVLIQLAFRDLISTTKSSENDLKAWVANQNYRVNENIEKDNFKLSVSYTDHLAKAFANESNRMAISCFETIEGVRREVKFPRNSAWMLIRAYYASYFAAHSLLRVFGRSCNQLTLQHLSKVYEIADLFGCTSGISNIEKGFYQAVYYRRERELAFVKLKDSHADTWQCFTKLVQYLIDNLDSANALAEQKLEVLEFLSNLKMNLARNGNSRKGNWLSSFRNKVNYQHAYGTWFPYDGVKLDLERIERNLGRWSSASLKPNMLPVKNDVEIFFSCCFELVVWCREMIHEVSNRIPEQNTSFSNGVQKVLNLANSY